MIFKNHQSDEAAKQGGGPRKGKRSMSAAERVSQLQEKLYCKAKQEREFKFYILYDKMFIGYMLEEAYRRVKANGGSSGVDNQRFEDIEAEGVNKFLSGLGEELRKRSYRPKAVKRVWIEKANGGQRPLGIPTIRDRVAQMVCKMIIEPIFEADFEECSYGFRRERSSKDAMKAIKEHLQSGKTEVLDADLSSYFDTIPHDKLQIILKQRITDERMLHLINLWLKSPVSEDGDLKGGRKQKTGTPQGGVISPLLANIYMHLVDKIVNDPRKLFYQLGIKMVRYADDFVLMGKSITEAAIKKLGNILCRMGLKLNAGKTRKIQAKETGFNFLGFTIRYDRDITGRNKRYWNIIPSVGSEKKMREKIKAFLNKSGHCTVLRIKEELNRLIRGWLNYYDVKGISYPSMSKRRLRHYLKERLYRYYNRKSQRRSRLYGQQAFEILVHKYGLINPTKYCV
ncbi:MAG TPA: group II intron reverse transcriptase/maturase [Flavitalea sp.]|nr:group II intron reverse transcriptase/maturase [Flavitalea sp.]